MRSVWFFLGGLSFGIGIMGIFLPLLPTTPLMILAAFCFSKSSPRIHNWLINHKVFGPAIQDWQQKGAINRKAKRMATIAIAAVFLLSVFLRLEFYLIAIQAVVLSCVMIFIWTRPDS